MRRYVHTYSILGRDDETGLMGGAVQSHYFCVGSGVLWAEAGVGVVATQSLVNFEIGRSGLHLLSLGYSPDGAMGTLLASDDGREHRQTAFLDASGRFAVHTGNKCIREAGHAVGRNCCVQANMMKNDTVPGAMKEAFETTGGSLDRRLLAALQAAQNQGGDIRGMQSAAMVIVPTRKTGRPETDKPLDLRVDDHPDPLKELERLLSLRKAYDLMDRADKALEQGMTGDAMEFYAQAEGLRADNPEMKYWHGITLADLGRLDEGRRLLSPVFRENPDWIELTRRLPEAGLVSFSVEDVEKLLEQEG
ncbi:MAG: DUF1028 domain-containing protein [Spirochaetales bacterium]|nr:DUF1028 domain-containing protein [Spirochaetales bacterium]